MIGHSDAILSDYEPGVKAHLFINQVDDKIYLEKASGSANRVLVELKARSIRIGCTVVDITVVEQLLRLHMQHFPQPTTIKIQEP